MFLLLSVLVPAFIYLFLPRLLEAVTGKRSVVSAPLIVACILYFISWYLPSPLIQGENTAFMTHFVGGGMFVGCLWLYAKQQVKWKSSFFLEVISLYAAVSAFGVANELFELCIVQIGVAHLGAADTWWDLLANTSGAFVFWVGYRVFEPYRSSP